MKFIDSPWSFVLISIALINGCVSSTLDERERARKEQAQIRNWRLYNRSLIQQVMSPRWIKDRL